MDATVNTSTIEIKGEKHEEKISSSSVWVHSHDGSQLNVPIPTCPHPGHRKRSPPASTRPLAPKRFKSAYIFFSIDKYKEVRTAQESQGASIKSADISKIISAQWKYLLPEGREPWVAKAQADRQRFLDETTVYNMTCQRMGISRTTKDPEAPKRPMSAFLAFSQHRRRILKSRHPDLSNGEISQKLSKEWKDLDPSSKQVFINQQRMCRLQYRVTVANWKKQRNKSRNHKNVSGVPVIEIVHTGPGQGDATTPPLSPLYASSMTGTNPVDAADPFPLQLTLDSSPSRMNMVLPSAFPGTTDQQRQMMLMVQEQRQMMLQQQQERISIQQQSFPFLFPPTLPQLGANVSIPGMLSSLPPSPIENGLYTINDGSPCMGAKPCAQSLEYNVSD